MSQQRALVLLGVAAAFGCNAIAGVDDLHPTAASSTSIATSGGAGATGAGGTSSVQVASSSASAGGTSGAGGAGGSGGAPPTSCTAQYGHVPFFILCSETQMVCSFYAHVEPQSCANLCASGGGECLLVYNNLNDMVGCLTDNTVSCNELTLGDGICVCSFGCGSGPPCVPSQTCMGGTCT